MYFMLFPLLWTESFQLYILVPNSEMGLSGFLCKRGFIHSGGSRSSNWMVNLVSAAFQSRIGIVHFWLMLRSTR